MKKVKFPKDENAHDSMIEWWYFNGHLEDKKCNKYSFMECLFRASLKKIKIPLLNRLPLKNLYFSHSVISNLKSKESYPKVEYLNLVSNDSFSKPLLFVNFTNPIILEGYLNSVIEKTSSNNYRLKTKDMELDMVSTKKPLLLAGTGHINVGSKNTYYYSLTSLKTTGRIKVNNKWVNVKGVSWMDRQWADVKYPQNEKDKWTWFSIQLNSKTEMVCGEYDTSGKKYFLASISLPNNKQEHAKDVRITPMEDSWKSPKTGVEYPTSWRIEIPSKKIDLTVKAIIKNQEMSFGTINYWEGPLEVKGIFKNKKAKGLGFMELVDHPFKFGNLDFLATSAFDVFKTVYSGSKSILFNLIR